MSANMLPSHKNLHHHHQFMDRIEVVLFSTTIAVTLFVVAAVVVMVVASFGWGDFIGDALLHATGWEEPSLMGG